jgi:2-dehydropantoate 2-reductase
MGQRIAFMGAGAVGGYVGGHLAHFGYDVTLIDPWPEHVEAVRAKGLDISGLTPEEHILARPKILHLTEVQGFAKQNPIDIAFICMKSYDTEWATAMIRQYLAPDGFVVSLQNCINEERIAALVGWGRTIGCVASHIEVELYEAGRVRRMVQKGGSHYTVFRIGEVHGRVTKRVEDVAAMIGRIDSIKVTSNLWGERWTKLCMNGMANGVSAATGLSSTDASRNDAIRRFAIQLGGEAVRIGRALGYAIETIGNLDPDRLLAASAGDAAALSEIDAVILAGTNARQRSADQRPSMGQDMRKGRRTEIEFMNGFIVAKGREVGLAAPANAALTDMVKRVERGEVAARPENVAELRW